MGKWETLRHIVEAYANHVSDEVAQDAYNVILDDMKHLDGCMLDESGAAFRLRVFSDAVIANQREELQELQQQLAQVKEANRALYKKVLNNSYGQRAR